MFTQTLQTIRRPAQPTDTNSDTTAIAGLLNLDNPESQLAETFANNINGEPIKIAKALTGGIAGLGNVVEGFASGEVDPKLVAALRKASNPGPAVDAAIKGIKQGLSTGSSNDIGDAT